MNPARKPAKPALKPANPAKASGFTIIEVALVLAIAGLIFLVVFLALPALQRSQRDNARKQGVARVAAAIGQFYADGGNNADIPLTTDSGSSMYNNSALGQYLKNAGLQSLGLSYISISGKPGSPPVNNFIMGVPPNQIVIYVGGSCGSTFQLGGSSRRYMNIDESQQRMAIMIGLENGLGDDGNDSGFCQNVAR